MEGQDARIIYYREGCRTKKMALTEDILVKPVEEYEGLYSVTDTGLLISHHRDRPLILRPGVGRDGYLRAVLHKKATRVTVYPHRLIAAAFVPNPRNKPQVNHINGDKADNRASNLEWCTSAENIHHGYATGLCKSGEAHGLSKLTKRDVLTIRKEAASGVMQKDIAARFGVAAMTISSIVTRKTWKHVPIAAASC